MGAAPLLLAIVMVTADVGWEVDGRGGYQYIVQVPVEQWESIKRDGEITSQIPENLRGKVSSIKIRVGQGPMPRHDIVASSEVIRKLPGPPDMEPTVRAQSDGFQMPNLQNLPEAGKEIVDNARQQIGNQFTDLANQAGQQVNEAVKNAATNMRDAAKETINNGFSNTPNSNRNPSAGPTIPPALQPTTASGGQPSTRSTGPPTTSPGAGPSSSPFPSSDAFGFSNRSGQTPPNQAQPTNASQPSTASPQNASPTFGGQQRTESDYQNYTAAGQTNSNPNAGNFSQPRTAPASAPTSNPPNAAATSSAWPPDPPSLEQNGTQPLNAAARAQLAIQQRLNAAQSRFHFDEYGDLVVDEAVLYVVGVDDQVDIDATGRLYDRTTDKWLRNNDPRYLEVINFIEQYNSVRKERLASANGVSNIQLRNPQTIPSTSPNYQPNGSPNLFESNPSATTGNIVGGFQGGYTNPAMMPAANPYNASQPASPQGSASQPSGAAALSLDQVNSQIELAMLRNKLEEVQKEKTTNTGQANTTTQSAVQSTLQTAGNSGSASDSDPRNRSSGDEMQSQPVFNFLLLLSILANAYLGIAISRLLKRYRNLVASHRGNTLVT